MIHSQYKHQVGAPDPQLKTSPILDDEDLEDYSWAAEEGDGACYFNDRTYALGDYVCSGDERLRCENLGVWVREGSCNSKG
ncbi:MAG: hypothetical protein ABW101_01730 [Candidatus Thiodiazotropha sp.]